MKRRAVMCVLLLVGEAIINWLVAWYLPRFGPERSLFDELSIKEWSDAFEVNDTPVEFESLGSYLMTVFAEGRTLDLGQQDSYGWGFDKSVSTIVDSRSMQTVICARCGWPMRSLHGGLDTVDSGSVNKRGSGLKDAIAIPDSPLMPKRAAPNEGVPFLPIGVIPLGFAVNTLFYAAILWLIFFAPAVVRRAHRRRNNRCLRCAYPIGASELCTECGTPIGRRSLA